MESGVSKTTLRFDTGERFVPLRRELDARAFGLNLIVLEPRQRGRVHKHEHQEEVYIVLEGTLTLAVEAEEASHARGDVVRVAPQVRRQLINRGSERLALIAIGGSGEHVGRDATAYLSWEASAGASPQEIPNPEDLPA